MCGKGRNIHRGRTSNMGFELRLNVFSSVFLYWVGMDPALRQYIGIILCDSSNKTQENNSVLPRAQRQGRPSVRRAI